MTFRAVQFDQYCSVVLQAIKVSYTFRSVSLCQSVLAINCRMATYTPPILLTLGLLEWTLGCVGCVLG